MYGVVHGGVEPTLREESVARLLSMGGFEGLAVGGSLGRSRADIATVLEVAEWIEEICQGYIDIFKRKHALMHGHL